LCDIRIDWASRSTDATFFPESQPIPRSPTAIVVRTTTEHLVKPATHESLWPCIQLYGAIEPGTNSDNTVKAKRRYLTLFIGYFNEHLLSDYQDQWTLSVTGRFPRRLENGLQRNATTVNRALATLRHRADWIHRHRPLTPAGMASPIPKLSASSRPAQDSCPLCRNVVRVTARNRCRNSLFPAAGPPARREEPCPTYRPTIPPTSRNRATALPAYPGLRGPRAPARPARPPRHGPGLTAGPDGVGQRSPLSAALWPCERSKAASRARSAGVKASSAAARASTVPAFAFPDLLVQTGVQTAGDDSASPLPASVASGVPVLDTHGVTGSSPVAPT
jgi:hypothetical protein